MRYFLLMLALTSTAYSQEKFAVYFDTDKYVLTPEQSKQLENFLRNNQVVFKKITGFCDFRASNAYNYQLGLNRANNILDQLPIEDKALISVVSKGEDFKQNAALWKNRRVEIEYEKFIPLEETVTKEEVVAEPQPLSIHTIEPIVDEYPSELQKKIINANVGDKILLSNLNFYVRSDEFYPESIPVLVDLYEVLEKNPNMKVEIQGHICCTPGRDLEEFSLRRCIAVYNFLVDSGIAEDRMTYVGFDATKPIFPLPEKNEEERKANRRVEIMILEK